MSSSKKKVSKSSKKQSANTQITPPPSNQQSDVYHPIMFSPQPDEPMFSPSQNQLLANLVYNLSQNQNPFPTPSQNLFTTPSPTLPDSQNSETQFFSTQPRRLLASDTEEEEEEEVEDEDEDEDEEEEQQQQRQRQQKKPSRGRAKGKAQVTEKSKKVIWKVDEVVALAKTWVDISEDETIGNDQESKVFQDKIWKLWCVRMGRVYRTSQSIYSKWRNISKIAKEFEAIFSQCQRNWQSGANLDDVMVTARQQYIDKHGTRHPFNHQAEAFWRVIRDNEKWKNQKTFHQFAVGGNKRFKSSTSTHSQSSDANVGFDMNEEPEDDVLPIGRDRAKRKQKGGSSATDSSTEMNLLNDQVATLQTFHEDKVRAKLIDVLTRNISDLQGFEYQVALEAKKLAAKRLGIHFDDGDQ